MPSYGRRKNDKVEIKLRSSIRSRGELFYRILFVIAPGGRGAGFCAANRCGASRAYPSRARIQTLRLQIISTANQLIIKPVGKFSCILIFLMPSVEPVRSVSEAAVHNKNVQREHVAAASRGRGAAGCKYVIYGLSDGRREP